MGITSTTTPEVLQTLDSSKTWVPMGSVDATSHSWTGYGAGTDVRTFGCKPDGTDQTACINNALANAPDCVVIPATPLGFYVVGTLTVTKCLRGTLWNPSNNALGFSGSSYIRCNNQAAQQCVAVNNSDKYAAQIENIIFTGSGATPVAGSIGLQWLGGFNLILNNVLIDNFGACAYFGPSAASGVQPTSMHSMNVMLSRCSKHYVVNDGLPELSFVGGRWGGGGSTDYNSADDFYFGTQTTAGGGGGGPNTLVIDGVQINPGNKTVGCAFRWGNFRTSPSGVWGANKIVNSHVEVLAGGAYTGTNPQRGMFCYDSTVPVLPEMKVIASDFDEDGAPKVLPILNIDPAVKWSNGSRLTFIGNEMQTAPFSMTIHDEQFAFGPTFIGNWFYQPATFTAGDITATAYLANNTFYSGYTIGGQWGSLNVSNNWGVLTDSATGNVYMSGDAGRAWTPTLTFGNASVGMTYGTQNGTIQRTPNGGFAAQASIVLTNKGTSTGLARIAGLPVSCGALAGAAIPVTLLNMSGLTGAVMVTAAGAANFAFVSQASATGQSVLTDPNFTNTSQIGVVINCGRTQ